MRRLSSMGKFRARKRAHRHPVEAAAPGIATPAKGSESGLLLE